MENGIKPHSRSKAQKDPEKAGWYEIDLISKVKKMRVDVVINCKATQSSLG